VSNTLAISTVTAAFAQLLTRALTDSGVSGGSVRLEPPDPLQATPEGPLLNLFLYDVGPHPAFRATEPRTLGLRLHYLLTSYGKGTANGGNQLEAQHVLAHAMSYVNDNAMLTRAHVRAAVKAYSAGQDAPYARLSKSDLEGEVELVKLTPLPQTPDDVSKLWAALNQSYRLSVCYEASAVLIKRSRPTRVAPPVREAGVYAITLRRPVIEAVMPQSVTVDDQLVLLGRNLRAPDTRVSFASGDADPAKTQVSDGEIVVKALPSGLRAGPNAVFVVHDVRMGQPPAPDKPRPLHRGFESNGGLFSLVPKITTKLTDNQGDPIKVARDTDFDIDVAPAVGRTQRVALLLGGIALDLKEWPAPPAGDPPATITTLRFRIPKDHPTGRQLIQVRVDGAESALELETDATDPAFNLFVAPKVDVT
jgi:hypothetical protein